MPLPNPLVGGGEVGRQSERTWEQASLVRLQNMAASWGAVPGLEGQAGLSHAGCSFGGWGRAPRGLLPRLAAVRWRFPGSRWCFPGLCVFKQGSWQLAWKPLCVLRGAALMHTQSLQSKLSESPGLGGSSKVTQQVHGESHLLPSSPEVFCLSPGRGRIWPSVGLVTVRPVWDLTPEVEPASTPVIPQMPAGGRPGADL